MSLIVVCDIIRVMIQGMVMFPIEIDQLLWLEYPIRSFEFCDHLPDNAAGAYAFVAVLQCSARLFATCQFLLACKEESQQSTKDCCLCKL